MDHSAITVRYAKAFFSLAKEKKLLEKLNEDINLVHSVCTHSADFVLLLKSPITKTSKKIELISSIFNGKIDDLTLDFLSLITRNNREVFIPGICRNFLELTRKDQNIRSAMLTTAAEISTESISNIENLLSKELEATIELSTYVNPEILGGLVLRIDDKQFDASVDTQLKNIKQKLLETEIK